MQKLKLDSVNSFESLFKELYPGMCSFADYFLKDEVQSKDIAQEAFIKLWGRKNEFSDIVSIKSYLYTTVRNLSLNYLRDHKRIIEISGQLPELSEPDVKAVIIEEEAIGALYSAIERLPQQSSKIISLSLKGLKNNEIADELKISVNTVKTLKYNALKTIRKDLEGIALLILFWLENS